MKKTKITSVTRMSTEVVCSLVSLRANVDALLAERQETHGVAAARAGVSGAQWSRTVNADNITQEQLSLLASGLDMAPEELKERCK